MPQSGAQMMLRAAAGRRLARMAFSKLIVEGEKSIMVSSGSYRLPDGPVACDGACRPHNKSCGWRVLLQLGS